MKIHFVLLLALVAILSGGCVIAKPGPGSTPRFTADNLAPAVDSAAYVGTVAFLSAHHDKREVFVQANDALTALISSDTVTLATLKAAVGPILRADIKELRDPRTALIVDGAVIVADVALGRFNLTEQQNAEARVIAVAARNGIARALVTVP